MGIIVKKFGGTSVADIQKIKDIAARISQEKKSDDSIVIVVSAMGNTTNELFDLATQISQKPSRRELDMLVTAGERISMSLLSLALQENALSAISFTGSQSGIITDIHHGAAKIINVKAFRIFEELNNGKIVIVAGYQGISTKKEVTTLGRGGSDTSAVALACYLKANKCEIFTDVNGIYTADPRKVSEAKIIPEITYKEMLALSYNGANVIHSRAVEFAYKYKIDVEIKSSFNKIKGTKLVDKIINEENSITAITTQKDIVLFSLNLSILNSKEFFENISDDGIELINFKFSDDNLTLFVQSDYFNQVKQILIKQNYSYKVIKDLKTLTFVGPGLSKYSLFVANVIDYLNTKNKCKIVDLIVQEISLTFVLKTEFLDDILKDIHTWTFYTGEKK